MSRPEILTKTAFNGPVCIDHEMKIYDPTPEGEGFATVEVDIELSNETELLVVERGERFAFKGTVTVRAFTEDLKEGDEGYDSPDIAYVTSTVVYMFQAKQDLPFKEIEENAWAFELSVRPLLLQRLRTSIDDSPLSGLPLELF